MAGFLQALPVVLGFEGGFTHDIGGDTYQGVTQKVYDVYRDKQNQPRRPVKEMAEDERDHLYFDGYWLAAKCEKLPWPLSLVHFDHAVNAGPVQAIRSLQLAVGADNDGVWGKETDDRLAPQRAEPHILMDSMLFARLEHYYVLAFMHPNDYGPYLKGWLGRVIKLRKKAWELW